MKTANRPVYGNMAVYINSIILQDFFRVSHWIVLPSILPTYTTCSSIYALPVYTGQSTNLIGCRS